MVQAEDSSAQVSAVVLRPCNTDRPLRPSTLRAASTTPWQIAATGLSAAKNAATMRCNVPLSR